MTLNEYLQDPRNKNTSLGKTKFGSNQSAVFPAEMRQELDKCINEDLAKFLSNIQNFLNNYSESPFHELMAVEFLLAKIVFSSKIKEDLNSIKTEIAQRIQHLYYLLEKPHPETASSGYTDRRLAQDEYLKEVIQAEENDPLTQLALNYFLCHIDDDTFNHLIKNIDHRSKETAINKRNHLKENQKFNTNDNNTYVAALATLEFYRVSSSLTYHTEEKHAAKNQRFYEEITRDFSSHQNSEGNASFHDLIIDVLISPPRPRSSHNFEPYSILSQDNELEYEKPTQLNIKKITTSVTEFYFSVSLPQSSISLLEGIKNKFLKSDSVEYEESTGSDDNSLLSSTSGQRTSEIVDLIVEVSNNQDFSAPNSSNPSFLRSVSSEALSCSPSPKKLQRQRQRSEYLYCTPKERSTSSRRSTGSMFSAKSNTSVELSVSVRQKSESNNFKNFQSAINKYYSQRNERSNALQKLVEIVTSLSDLKNVIVVYAPEAKKALKDHNANANATSMDDIYAHLYILLYSIVFATSTTATLNNPSLLNKERKAKTDAATILEWLSNPGHDNLMSALKEVHARMLEKGFSGEKKQLQMLSWRDESRCSKLHDNSCLKDASPHSDNSALRVLRDLPFEWSQLYRKGAHETNGLIIEKRRYYEVIAADALHNILNDSLRDQVKIEGQWLILKAIADYNKVRDYQKKNEKSPLLAESPFFNAIRLLAVICPLASINADAQTREKELCQHLYQRVFSSLFKYYDQLSRQQKLLKDELLNLVLEVEDNSAKQSSSSITPVARRLVFSDQGSNKESISTDSKEDELSFDDRQDSNNTLKINFWDFLYEKHFEKNSADRLTEDEIKFILDDFDRKCERILVNDGSHINRFLPLLNKAFEEMTKIFNKPKPQTIWSSFNLFASSRELPPINFDSFMKCIEPKSSLTPYVFAQYCVYQSRRINDTKITHLFSYEDHFIRENLVSLYDDDSLTGRNERTEKLNLMQVLVFEGNLGDCVAPKQEPTNTSAISIIFPKLNREICALESQSDNVTPEQVEPYDHMIKNKRQIIVPICCGKTSSGNPLYLNDRITMLKTQAQENEEKKSKKCGTKL
jgi:hypothetical protein